MTGPAQNALRRIMETSSMITRFILICNYLSGIIPPIQSRCAIFQFKRIGKEEIESHLLYITKKEKLTLTKGGAETLVEICEGDLRKAINTLQTAAALSKGKIDEKIILRIAHQATPTEIQTMLNLSIGGDFEKARIQMYQLMTKYALSGRDIIKQLHKEISKTTLLTSKQRLKVIGILSDYDFRLMEGANEDIQLSAFLAHLTQIGSEK
jgi:replication factor C small subunit